MRYKSGLLITALVLSLGVNGIVLVRYANHKWKASQAADARRAGQYPSFLADIPQQKRQAFQDQRKADAPYLRENAKKRTALRDEMVALLGADDFSEEAYRNKWKEMLALQDEMQQKRAEPLIALAVSLSPEERKKLAERLKSKRPDGKHPIHNQEKHAE